MIVRWIAVLWLAVPVAAWADSHGGGLDTSKSLRCALADAAECDAAAECSGVEIAAIELPEFWRVDFAGKQIASLDGQRTSPVASVEALDEVLVLQGHQNGRGWTMVVDRATGHLAVAAAGVEGAFVLSGGCIAE